ncbi:hypothetical protein GTY54_18405 [Streptomyces sp. SID625]|nr:hypothetical protein [Streptomyces sp. SID625]
MVDPFVPMRGTPGKSRSLRCIGHCDAAVARDHGFGCVQQMQGQMHVHVTELGPPVPLTGHFFRHLLDRRSPSSRLSLCAFLRSLSVSVIMRVLLEVF